MLYGAFPFALPFPNPLLAAPFLFNPFLTLPIGVLAGAFDRSILPGFVSFPPGGVI